MYLNVCHILCIQWLASFWLWVQRWLVFLTAFQFAAMKSVAIPLRHIRNANIFYNQHLKRGGSQSQMIAAGIEWERRGAYAFHLHQRLGCLRNEFEAVVASAWYAQMCCVLHSFIGFQYILVLLNRTHCCPSCPSCRKCHKCRAQLFSMG